MGTTYEIEQICNDLLQRYKDEISKTGHDASGKLSDSATYKIKYDGKWVEIIFNLQPYWKYLENGTKPHFPPVEAIESWIRVKHIIPSSNNGKIPTTKQLAYLIARGISRNGTQPTKLLQKTINSSDDLINELVNAIIAQIENETNKEIDNSL